MWMIQTTWWNGTLCIFVFYKVCILQVNRNIWLQMYKTVYFLERFKTDFEAILYVSIPRFLVMLLFVWKEKDIEHLPKVSLNYFYGN